MPCSTKHLHLLKYEFTYLNLHKYALKLYTGKPQHSPRSCCKESVMQLNGLRRRTEFRHREKQLVYLQCKPKCTYVQCRVWIQRSVGKREGPNTHDSLSKLQLLSPHASTLTSLLTPNTLRQTGTGPGQIYIHQSSISNIHKQRLGFKCLETGSLTQTTQRSSNEQHRTALIR